MDIYDPHAPVAGDIRVKERGAFLDATGRVRRNGETLDAACTLYKGDVAHMTRDQLFAYLERRLPDYTVERDWMAEVMA